MIVLDWEKSLMLLSKLEFVILLSLDYNLLDEKMQNLSLYQLTSTLIFCDNQYAFIRSIFCFVMSYQ